jgi:hypothetical protein
MNIIICILHANIKCFSGVQKMIRHNLCMSSFMLCAYSFYLYLPIHPTLSHDAVKAIAGVFYLLVDWAVGSILAFYLPIIFLQLLTFYADIAVCLVVWIL